MSKTHTPWLLDEQRKVEMNEDTQLRMEAVRLAVRALEDCAVEMKDMVEMASEIYEFIKGETK